MKKGWSETLTNTPEYQLFYPDHQKYWPAICAELQTYDANSLVSLFRGNKGVLYHEILTDVCDKLAVLLDTEEAPPYLIYHEAPQHSPSLFGAFAVLTQSIIDKRCIQFLYCNTTIKGIAPYKLIYFNGHWYFCGVKVKNKAIQVFYALNKEIDNVFT
ncbi:WYL domain-containing protein [Proteus sp. TJ1640]|uniref:WYL domain-containing protein n=1 Tax=Proteus sp. TJ1640 TaxID=2050968 RepID=UPI001EF7472D|nr:WYL domain-containing protein [Proteus sp. TJ1640]